MKQRYKLYIMNQNKVDIIYPENLAREEEVKEIKKEVLSNVSYYDNVISEILVNQGKNKFEYLKYTKEKNIDLYGADIHGDAVKVIADSIKFNQSIESTASMVIKPQIII